MMPASRGKALLLALLVLIVYTLLFQDLRGLWESSEGRYVNVAIEMLRFDDWLHPMTHHEHPHWTKPPLTYWAIAASIDTLGRSEFVMRLPGMFGFILTTLFVWQLGRLFHPQRPWLPALIYASFMFPASASNFITTDSLLAAAVTASFTGFCYAIWGKTGSFGARYGALFGWFAAGLGYLIKGPAVALPLFALLLFYIFQHRAFVGVRLYWIPGLILSALVASSWFLMLAGENPSLFFDFIYNEVLVRATSDKHQRNAEWYGGLRTYLPVLLIGTLPWWVYVWRGFKKPLLAWYRSFRGGADRIDEKQKFLLLWFLFPMTVFMLVKSRLPFYILPLFVPLALLAASEAEALFSKRRWYLVPMAGVAFVLVFRLVLGVADHFKDVSIDSRMLARQLEQIWPAKLDEVVFVSHEAQQGLSFYMDAEVEQLAMNEADVDEAQQQTVADELLNEGDNEDRLWIVRRKNAEAFEAVVKETGYEAGSLGEARGRKPYRVYRVDMAPGAR
ncbi:ArnT family glycosyltransferase [Solemya velum gill symbiont]|uniref:ArnT family glycosyltransferase n=1 Tax=Solemya velum gill symbiont TaxID=2340 RepID=UPI0009961E7A|nr:glycosyltransferase family 39 protein [Solemya velum gill symbiont]OOY99061.1 hypothetical protein BOW19_06270 [Solemya velum gill symbiont]OOZ01324.1 hypothetical protein BOW20_05930 [Solemya velum gill symbiont]OOZ03545.1 hypothetical protein BOW21_06300 [Solemya velum gill symbiont]OOZ05749.1 hypothetical protein BOW22_06000 [Solemya velum gill symbiont]OOZ07967.1 hypothetical protein BOW23_06000 [Solemya velum gill symbiont]